MAGKATTRCRRKGLAGSKNGRICVCTFFVCFAGGRLFLCFVNFPTTFRLREEERRVLPVECGCGMRSGRSASLETEKTPSHRRFHHTRSIK